MQENAPSPARISLASIPFSFAFTVIALVELLIVLVMLVAGTISLRAYARELENNFYQRGKELALAVSASAASALEQNRLDQLADHFTLLAGDNKLLPGERSINEIILLDKTGVVLAHSDLSQVNDSNQPAQTIALKYNNDFFHAALLVQKGQVINQNYPYPIVSLLKKSTYLLQGLLPEKLDYAMDFSTPVLVNGQTVATAHVVLNRVFIYNFLVASVKNLAAVAAIFMAGGLLVASAIMLAFLFRARAMEKMWLAFFQSRWDVSQKLNEVELKLERLEHNRQLASPATDPKTKDEQEIQEAILIE